MIVYKKLIAMSKKWFIGGLRVQLLMVSLSLPILIAWGLPISIMSIVGNLIALPFLVAALFLCSLLFLTELTGIPNTLLYLVTDKLISIWHYLLSFGSPSWLVGFSAPPLAASIILSFFMAWGLWYSVHKYKVKLEFACIVAMASCLGLCYILKYQFNEQIPHIHCISRNNKRLVIDDGFFSFKTSYRSPIRYRIKPLLYKAFGDNHIHRWHCTYGGTRSLRALHELLNEILVDEISIGILPKKQSLAWQTAWQELHEKCLKNKVQLTMLIDREQKQLKLS